VHVAHTYFLSGDSGHNGPKTLNGNYSHGPVSKVKWGEQAKLSGGMYQKLGTKSRLQRL